MISLPNPDLEDFSKVLKFSPVPEKFYRRKKLTFLELWEKTTADYFIVDIEDPETINRRLVIDKTFGVGDEYDNFEVVEVKAIPNNFCYGALGDKKLKNGLHIILREL